MKDASCALRLLGDPWDTKQFKHQTKLSKTPRNYVAEFSLSFVSPARREAITLIVNKQAKVKTYGVHVAPIFLPKSFLITQHFRQNTKD